MKSPKPSKSEILDTKVASIIRRCRHVAQSGVFVDADAMQTTVALALKVLYALRREVITLRNQVTALRAAEASQTSIAEVA